MRTVALCIAGALAGALTWTDASLCAAESAAADARAVVDLSGPWEFKTDALDVGRKEEWFRDSVRFDRTIQVPGAWNAQGVTYDSEAALREFETRQLEEHKHLYGLGTLGKQSESAKLVSAYPGPGWYRKRLTIPADWKDKIPWLIFKGVHREAEVWINGQPAGKHSSYLIPFRVDLSRYAKAGETVTVTARVDARRNRQTDPLMGCFDTLDFLYVTWGGLYRAVVLEATEATRIGDFFVIPRLASNSAEIRVSIEGPRPAQFRVEADIIDASGATVATANQAAAEDPETVLRAAIPNPKLWSPQSPHLYEARVRFLAGDRKLDARSVRFGMREFSVQGGKFVLNGQPIFLRGYGDDCIFPKSISPPADKGELRRRLAAAREFGFNYVRHHSWTPPEEYLDAADELGMMLQPEFPFAYRWDLPATPEAKRSALEQWEALIRLHRNHPSIVTWCMGNELYESFDLAPQMFETAKRLDPTRPVIDSDGAGFGHQNRRTLDFMVVQFNEGSSIGFEDTKYHIPETIQKPVIAHEMGYFVTLPDLGQLNLFGPGLRPYWLFQARELAESNGLLEAYPAWLAASYRLQAACLKSNMEAARRSRLSGTSVWLFQDYPNCAEGVVDMFFRPKGISAEEFRQFNSPTVLLLDVSRRNWRAGEPAEFKFLISRFEDPPSSARLRWTLARGAEPVASGTQEQINVSSGGVQELPMIKLDLPALAQASQLTLHAELLEPSRITSNSWKFWTFPTARLEQGSHRLRVSGFAQLRTIYPWAQEWSPGAGSATDLLVTARLDDEARAYLAGGGRVFLVDPAPAFAVEKTNFRLSSWDGGGPSGTILDPGHAALRAMPSEGWCDLQFYRLIQNSTTVFLNALPGKIRPLVRCIDRPTRLADRAYLFEASVGEGKLLVSGFNFRQAIETEDSGAIYLFDQLVRYALGNEFKPESALPVAALLGKAAVK